MEPVQKGKMVWGEETQNMEFTKGGEFRPNLNMGLPLRERHEKKKKKINRAAGAALLLKAVQDLCRSLMGIRKKNCNWQQGYSIPPGRNIPNPLASSWF